MSETLTEDYLDGLEEYIPKKQRDALPIDDFAWPEKRTYPVDTQDHLDSIVTLIGQAPDAMQPKIKARALSIAKRKGFTIPSAWKEEDKPNESTLDTSPSFSPKARIATFNTCFIQDNAKSRNGRIYPAEAVNRLLQSGQSQLSTPNADPLTCYISHEEADKDDSLKLAGKITHLWRQGSEGWARIEMPDTHTGRDAATLAKGGYLKTSLRASKAEMRIDKASGLPVVGGDNLRLDGIDFTTTPGIESVTVQDVVLESAAPPQSINEVFEIPTESLLVETFEVEQEQSPMPTPQATDVSEGAEVIPSMASGETPGLTSDNPKDDYSQKMYPVPTLSSSDGSGDVMREAVQHAHDHSAAMLNLECAPKEAMMEAGKALNFMNLKHAKAMHEKSAKTLGMPCAESAKSQPDSDNALDASGDDQMLPVKGKKEAYQMTPDEAAKVLEAAGYKIERPKSKEELLQERLDRMEALMVAQQQSFTEQMSKLTALPQVHVPNPQRKTVIENPNVPASQQRSRPYVHGSYIKEQLAQVDLERLADRSYPWPEHINPAFMVKELEHALVELYDERYGTH